LIDANPSVDDALKQVRDAIIGGATLPFGDDALLVVPERVRPSFEERLRTPGTWARASRNVLAASRQVGIIATAIATLRHETVISRDVMDVATTVVQSECRIDMQEGRWCT